MTLPFSTSTINRAEIARRRYLARLQNTGTQSRPADGLAGKEVVIQPSKRPIVVRPPLGATPKELSDHRADTHRKLAHWISDKIAYATGPIDGIIDAVVNGAGELIEDGAFFVSKTFHGTKHGWSRGKFPENRNQ